MEFLPGPPVPHFETFRAVAWYISIAAMFVGLVTLLILMFGPAHAETTVKHYPRVDAPMAHDRILIVAPHIDDEVIAAAGYAEDALANGAEVFVVFLTAGDCNRFSARLLNRTFEPTMSNYLTVGRTRIGEAREAMRLLGVNSDHYFILGYPDRGLRPILENRMAIVRSSATGESSVPYDDAFTPGAPYSYSGLMSDVERVLTIARPTTVIAPVSFDLHPDHAAAAEITNLALAAEQMAPRRLGYLVHASRIPISLVRMPERALVPPSRMRGLDWGMYPLTPAVQKKKDQLLQTYKSQRPYTSILRNAFVRTNELFYLYDAAAPAIVPPAAKQSQARIPIAR